MSSAAVLAGELLGAVEAVDAPLFSEAMVRTLVARGRENGAGARSLPLAASLSSEAALPLRQSKELGGRGWLHAAPHLSASVIASLAIGVTIVTLRAEPQSIAGSTELWVLRGRAAQPNKELKLTKPGKLWSFAA